MTEEGYYHAIANAIGSEFVNLKDFAPPADLLKLLPAGLAQLHRAFPGPQERLQEHAGAEEQDDEHRGTLTRARGLLRKR